MNRYGLRPRILAAVSDKDLVCGRLPCVPDAQGARLIAMQVLVIVQLALDLGAGGIRADPVGGVVVGALRRDKGVQRRPFVRASGDPHLLALGDLHAGHGGVRLHADPFPLRHALIGVVVVIGTQVDKGHRLCGGTGDLRLAVALVQRKTVHVDARAQLHSIIAVFRRGRIHLQFSLAGNVDAAAVRDAELITGIAPQAVAGAFRDQERPVGCIQLLQRNAAVAQRQLRIRHGIDRRIDGVFARGEAQLAVGDPMLVRLRTEVHLVVIIQGDRQTLGRVEGTAGDDHLVRCVDVHHRLEPVVRVGGGVAAVGKRAVRDGPVVAAAGRIVGVHDRCAERRILSAEGALVQLHVYRDTLRADVDARAVKVRLEAQCVGAVGGIQLIRIIPRVGAALHSAVIQLDGIGLLHLAVAVDGNNAAHPGSALHTAAGEAGVAGL